MPTIPWFQVIQTVLTALAYASLWGVKRAYRTGEKDATVTDRLTTLEGRADETDRRFDQGSAQFSKLASTVNGLPVTLQSQFVTLAVYSEHVDRGKEERRRMDEEVRAMRKRCDDCVAAWRARRHE